MSPIIGWILIACAVSGAMLFSSCSHLEKTREIRVLLVGDSTVTDDAGWGGAIGAFFKPNVTVINRAVGGASSKNYFDGGYLKRAIAEAKPDYVFIQFGHNDMPGKGPKRETDPATTYMDYMKRYVEEARKVGAKPILVTSVARRTFKGAKIFPGLAAYAHAVERVGKETNVPVIDLHTRSIELYERLGYAASDFMQPKGDHTHFNAQGAQVLAEIVAKELSKLDPGTAKILEREGF